jgi:hypothetical protein
MRTTEFIRIEGRFEIWGVYLNGVLLKTVRRLIRNW